MAGKAKFTTPSFSTIPFVKTAAGLSLGLQNDRLTIRDHKTNANAELVFEITDRPVFAAECWDSFEQSQRGGLKVEAKGRMGAMGLRVTKRGDGVLAVEYTDDLAKPATRRVRLRAASGKDVQHRGDILIAKTKPSIAARIVTAASVAEKLSADDLAGLRFNASKQFGILLLLATASTEKAALAKIEKALS